MPQIASIVAHDELDLTSLGEKKTALFAVIPDNDSSLNYIIGMMYTQLFQELYYSADFIHHGSLPVHVHCMMDEFANVALPDEFDKLLATMRSREISVSIIIQNIAQLKALFEKQWESIIGNCDEFLYLGGNEDSTHELVSKKLGKETIDINTYGQSKGRNGNYSTNWQLSGRELMTPDEVRMLDNRYALLFVRGERAVQDDKYDILKHPNIALTVDGGAARYIHGIAPHAFDLEEIILDANFDDYEILSEVEVNQFYEMKETKKTAKLKMSPKMRKAFMVFCVVVMVFSFTTVAFATDDPLEVVNNLSEFIFGLIRAIGIILLAFGIVQVGLALKSHDPSQRANGFLTLAGGIIITFAREILTLITG